MKYKHLGAAAIVVAMVLGGLWFFEAHPGAAGQIGPNAADPAYIVVNTPTPVTFTSVIVDSNQVRHHPNKVLLVRTDASGIPIDIVGRMRDNGKKADAERKDHTFTIRTTLGEPSLGTIQFRVAAKFKRSWPAGKDPDGDDDWDTDLAVATAVKDKNQRRERLAKLLKRLDRYTLSDSFPVTVDPTRLPPDPGEVGKQTLEGIDSDEDGVRDDVQRQITYQTQSSGQQQAALTQYARSLQQSVTGTEGSAGNGVAAIRCIASRFGVQEMPGQVAFIRQHMLNTPDRVRAYLGKTSAPSQPVAPELLVTFCSQ